MGALLVCWRTQRVSTILTHFFHNIPKSFFSANYTSANREIVPFRVQMLLFHTIIEYIIIDYAAIAAACVSFPVRQI